MRYAKREAPQIWSVGSVRPDHVTAQEFAALAGCDESTARRAFGRGQFGDDTFRVTEAPGQGGPEGKIRLVPIVDLPPALYERAREIQDAARAAETLPVGDIVDIGNAEIDPRSAKDSPLAMWKLDLISPALRHPKGSAERKAALAAAAGRRRRPDGKLVSVSERTLYDWLGRYEHGGLAGLRRKPDSRRGTRRVLVSEAWDAACPLPTAPRERIAAEITGYVRSL